MQYWSKSYLWAKNQMAALSMHWVYATIHPVNLCDQVYTYVGYDSLLLKEHQFDIS